MQYKEIDGVRYYKPTEAPTEGNKADVSRALVLAALTVIVFGAFVFWALTAAGCTPAICY